MPAPKGHAPYAGCEKGAAYGYLGKPSNAWKKCELEALGKELVQYMERKDVIWYSGFLARKGITHQDWDKLKDRYSNILEPYVNIAAALQEEKLVNMPFFKKADCNHARLVLRKAHEPRWAKTLNEHAKSEKSQDLGQATIDGIIEAARGLSQEVSGISKSSEPVMETNESLLDQEQEREKNII